MVNPDPDPFGSQDFDFLDPDPRIKISSKNCKKKFCLKTQFLTNKKRDYKNFMIFEWFIKF